MMNEEELDLALADYLPDNVSTTYSFQRWAHSPGRERARRLLIRFRFSTTAHSPPYPSFSPGRFSFR